MAIDYRLSPTGVLQISGSGTITDEEVIHLGKKRISKVIINAADITSIGVNAFYGCSKLTKVMIADGPKSIEDNAFQGCTSLSYIFIPKSVTKIGADIFHGCSKLQTVEYGGRWEQWDSLECTFSATTPDIRCKVV